jgi:hypothetical protein
MSEKDTEFRPREPEEDKDQTLRENEKDVEGHGGLAEPHLEPGLPHSDEGDEVEGHHGLGPEPAIGP